MFDEEEWEELQRQEQKEIEFNHDRFPTDRKKRTATQSVPQKLLQNLWLARQSHRLAPR